MPSCSLYCWLQQTCACASFGYGKEGGLGRKALTFKHLQPWGDIGASLPSDTATRSAVAQRWGISSSQPSRVTVATLLQG